MNHLGHLILIICTQFVEARLYYSREANSYDDSKAACTFSELLLTNVKKLLTCFERYADFGKLTFWLPIRKITLNTWYTLDGIPYAKAISEASQRVETQDCAVLRTADKLLDEISCHERTDGYICETDEHACLQSQDCIQEQGKTYIIYREKGDWFDGYESCNRRHMQLASWPKSAEDKVSRHIHDKVSKQGHLRVGIFWSVWKFDKKENPGDFSSSVVQQYHWQTKLPAKSIRESCAVAVFTNLTSNWAPSPCQEKHYSICEETVHDVCDRREKIGISISAKQPSLEYDSVSSTNTVPPSANQEDKWTMKIFYLLLVFMCVAAVIALSWPFRRLRQKIGQCISSATEEVNEAQSEAAVEREKLLHSQENVMQKQNQQTQTEHFNENLLLEPDENRNVEVNRKSAEPGNNEYNPAYEDMTVTEEKYQCTACHSKMSQEDDVEPTISTVENPASRLFEMRSRFSNYVGEDSNKVTNKSSCIGTGTSNSSQPDKAVDFETNKMGSVKNIDKVRCYNYVFMEKLEVPPGCKVNIENTKIAYKNNNNSQSQHATNGLNQGTPEHAPTK